MYDAVFSSRAFSWCVISWFYFPWKVNLRNYSSRLVIWRFCVTREETDYLTDIRDFTTLFHAILRCKSSERLESSIESVELRLCPSRFLWEQVIRNIILITCLFSWFGKTNLYICNPCSSIFSVREPWQRPPSPPPVLFSLSVYSLSYQALLWRLQSDSQSISTHQIRVRACSHGSGGPRRGGVP